MDTRFSFLLVFSATWCGFHAGIGENGITVTAGWLSLSVLTYDIGRSYGIMLMKEDARKEETRKEENSK